MENNKIDITQYLNRFYRTIVRMKKWLIIIVLLLIAVNEVRTVFFFHTTYSSQSVFVIYEQGQDNIFATSDDGETMISSFSQLICGTMMQDVVKQSLNLADFPAQVSLSQYDDTNLAVLKVVSDDAQLSYDIISCILNNYKQVTDYSMSDISISIIDTPFVASQPDSYPDYLKEGIKGLIAGLVIDFVIVFVMMTLRKTIIENDDVKNELHLQNITKIPYIELGKKRRNFYLLLSNPRIQYTFQHAFSNIRLKLEQERNNNGYQIFMIASTLPNEGKSTIAVNTAISLAQKGYKTVLVDLDLRNPSVFHILKENKICGNIGDYLKENYCFEEIVNQYQDYPLDIIYGMKSYDEATELLSKDRFSKLIALLKTKYEFVILDVPPLYMLEDAMIISRYCDSSLIVIRQDYASIASILDALEELNIHLPHISGTIINQSKRSLFNGEEHSYGYGYK